ncbi:MAG: cytidylyltransferase [Candidatus Omnitrophota bacterium]
MISALLIGRKGSVGFPGKNTYPVLGHPLAYYPMKAAKNSRRVDKVFISTDCEKLMQLAEENSVAIIKRPEELCTKTALGENVFIHGFNEIVKREGRQELVVLLHCNSATVTSDLIDQGIGALRENPAYDSAVSVSRYNMWSPIRARKIGEDGLLHPFVPFENFGDPQTLNCDRDSQGDVYFADMGVSVVRPRCLENIKAGLLPQKWMGQKIFPLIQEGGCDVDYEYQISQTEFWLKKNSPGTVPPDETKKRCR